MCSLLHVKKILILIWLKICYQRKRYIYSEENCKKNGPVNTWMFWDFYYPIFNTKNSKRKTIRFWLKGSKNLQICFSIYLLKINFFPIQMQENNTMYSNQFFYTTTKSSNTVSIHELIHQIPDRELKL